MSEEIGQDEWFTQGVAWAIATCADRHDAGFLLHESGLTIKDFERANVGANDLRKIKQVALLEGLK